MTAPTPTPDPAAVLARWREVEQAATEGEWAASHDRDGWFVAVLEDFAWRQLIAVTSEADATFIATARTALPALLAAVEALLALANDVDPERHDDESCSACWADNIRAAIATAIGGVR